MTRVIFFTSKEGLIGKDMQNYMEAELIKFFDDSERKLENGNVGQSANIIFSNRFKSDNLLKSFREILELFNIDLMSVPQDEIEEKVIEESSKECVIEFNRKTFDLTGNINQRKEVLKFVREVYQVNKDYVLGRIYQGKISMSHFFATEQNISAAGTKYGAQIQIGELSFYVFTNLNKRNKIKMMHKIKKELAEFEQRG